jgi:hypothetical protein
MSGNALVESPANTPERIDKNGEQGGEKDENGRKWL